MLIILQNHRLSFTQICMSSSSFSYHLREPPFIQQSSSSSIFSRTIFYPSINLMFSDLSQFLLLHIIRAGIIYIYPVHFTFSAIQHSSPFRFFKFPSTSPNSFYDTAVLSLSATEIENSTPPPPPKKKSLPFSNLLLIALGSPPLNNQSTDTFFLSDFSTRLITPPLTHYHLFLCLPLSLFPPPSAHVSQPLV